jgi:hypothetical protein
MRSIESPRAMTRWGGVSTPLSLKSRLASTSLGFDLVHRGPRGVGAAAGKRNALLLEDLLEAAVLAEASVEGDEGHVHVHVVDLAAVLGVEIDRHDLVADGLERLGDGRARPERDFALGRATAHEDADDRM